MNFMWNSWQWIETSLISTNQPTRLLLHLPASAVSSWQWGVVLSESPLRCVHPPCLVRTTAHGCLLMCKPPPPMKKTNKTQKTNPNIHKTKNTRMEKVVPLCTRTGPTHLWEEERNILSWTVWKIECRCWPFLVRQVGDIICAVRLRECVGWRAGYTCILGRAFLCISLFFHDTEPLISILTF